MITVVSTCDDCGADQDTMSRETCEFCNGELRIAYLLAGGEEVKVIDATWLDATTGNPADHCDVERGYYEAHLPDSGTRITSADRYQVGMIGDVWHADDDHGGGDEIDTPEFRAVAIRLVGGPRHGDQVA